MRSYLKRRTRRMYLFQFQYLPGSRWQSTPPPLGSEQPGTSSWPMMWSRSMGILYSLQHHAESLAEARYIFLVNDFRSPMYPACSMPMLCVLVFHHPACQAMFLSRTHWNTRPFLLTT